MGAVSEAPPREPNQIGCTICREGFSASKFISVARLAGVNYFFRPAGSIVAGQPILKGIANEGPGGQCGHAHDYDENHKTLAHGHDLRSNNALLNVVRRYSMEDQSVTRGHPRISG
jgi:hypothetical protein